MDREQDKFQQLWAENCLSQAIIRDAPTDIVILLMSARGIRSSINNRELHAVMRKKRCEQVKILSYWAACLGGAELKSPLNINTQDEDGDTALHEAVRRRRWELVPVLLDHGADINLCDGWNQTPLHHAAHEGAPVDVIAQLISAHNVNVRDKNGNTALHRATRFKRWELVSVLLQHGADVNLGNGSNETPLHFSICGDAPKDIVTHLISARNVNLKSVCGRTALHDAVKYDRRELVVVLLQHGADPSLLDSCQHAHPFVHSLKALCIVAIRRHMSLMTDEAYNGLGLPATLIAEIKLIPQAGDIVDRGQSVS